MHVVVVGTSFVGLVTAVCIAGFGFKVTVYDESEDIVSNLKQNRVHIYEPGLDALIEKYQEDGMLFFSNDITDINDDLNIVILALQSPYRQNGEQDLTKFISLIDKLCETIKSNVHTTIVVETTVPIGTCDVVRQRIAFHRPDLTINKHYDIVSNPCFLREGSAIHDFVIPDRVIIGIDKEAKIAREDMECLYDQLLKTRIPVIFASIEEAEIIKSASNSFLATKIAFINEISDLCERSGADINTVVKGIGSDPGISFRCLEVGPGYNSYAFDRDTRVLVKTAYNLGCDLSIISATISSNDNRKVKNASRIRDVFEEYGGISGKNICVLGLTTKPETDDIKNSASLVMIEELRKMGVAVTAYDPIYSERQKQNMKLPNRFKGIELKNSMYEAVNNVDAVVIAVECLEFRLMDTKKVSGLIKKHGRKPIIIDFINIFDALEIQDSFRYVQVGRNICA